MPRHDLVASVSAAASGDDNFAGNCRFFDVNLSASSRVRVDSSNYRG